MHRLTQRADFLAAAKGHRRNVGTFVLQTRERGDAAPPRFGFPAPTTVPAPGTPPAPGQVSQPGAPPAPGQAPPVAQIQTREAVLAASPRIQIETAQVKGSIALKGARIDDLALTQYHETVDPKS